MPRFLPEPPHQHGTPAATAVVLVNLGTPDAPTGPALKRYLGEFLSDPRVVEIPKALWWLILNGIILNVRPKKSAAKYATVWTADGSPLRVYTERQTQLVKDWLDKRGHQLTVTWAMRYGTRAVPEVLAELKAAGVRRMLLVPMYPQYAASTTATVTDEACRWLLKTRNQPEMRFIRNYHDDTGYIDALAQSVREHWEQKGALDSGDKLVMSFHGLPKRSLTLGDPYFCECQKTGRLLAERLGLSPAQYVVCFQSRFGKAEWLQPYTAPTLQALARSGTKRVDLICPGFVADCLETLEEIAMEGKEDFLTAGGQSYHYIPALNTSPAWIDALGALVERHLGGWETKTLPDPVAGEACAARARTLGG